MSSSTINAQLFQAKIGSIQNQADSSAVYSNGVWSFKNSTALTSVTITDSGNVGIGTDSPTSLGSNIVVLDIKGKAVDRSGGIRLATSNDSQAGVMYMAAGVLFCGTTSSNPVAFQTNSVERMRIDASGDLLVGMTSGGESGKIRVTSSNCIGLTVNTNTGGGINFNYSLSSGTVYYNYFKFNGSVVGSVSSTGTGVSYNPSSDERLKENIEPLSNALETVKKLQPRRYTWKVNGSSDDGFIAQEIQQIPEFAHRVNSIGEQDGEIYYGVDYMRFVTYLTAAIQELSAKVDAQAAEIEALKAK